MLLISVCDPLAAPAALQKNYSLQKAGFGKNWGFRVPPVGDFWFEYVKGKHSLLTVYKYNFCSPMPVSL